MTDPSELDHPVLHALSGPHRGLGLHRGHAARYRPTVARFAALPTRPGPGDWDDLAALTGDDELVLFGLPHDVPAGWAEHARFDVAQMVAPDGFGRRHAGIERLTAADAPAMVALVEETQPGPFLEETHLIGAYYGVKEDGVLVAMAGERLATPSWVEISAVCTRASHRGRGLATRLVEEVAAGIRGTGRRPFLHTGARNDAAIALYERLGFARRDAGNVVQRIGVVPA